MAKSIHVYLADHRIAVLQDGELVRTITDCSFGRDGHRTPTISHGCLSLTKRDVDHHSTLYDGASMRYALFFEQDLACAFHVGDTAVASHGCIHLNELDAKWLFQWAAHDSVALDIDGPYPANPISHTGVGA